jgi:hypothetical protein
MEGGAVDRCGCGLWGGCATDSMAPIAGTHSRLRNPARRIKSADRRAVAAGLGIGAIPASPRQAEYYPNKSDCCGKRRRLARSRLQKLSRPVMRGHTERWPSGLRRTLGKRVCGKPYRGFESHSLRQLAIPNVPNLHQSA